jgi:chloramphenicol 3-O phosphotransferase
VAVTPGRIVLLNGASSSGKSTLARELLDVFDEAWFHLPVDAFNAMRARKDLAQPELEAILRRTRQGYHRAVAGMVQAGNSVLADCVLSEPWRLDDIVEQWGEIDVTMVGVHCPLDELNRREGARGERVPGTAESQFHVVHSGVEYDCEVDTSAQSARECAYEIRQMMQDRRRPGAFDRLVAGRSPR